MRTRALALLVLRTPSAAAQPDSYDFDFITITHTDNPGFSLDPPGQYHHGRGSVPYEYRMATTEISTAQWMEFANSLAQRGPVWALQIDPQRWGARLNASTFTYELRTDLDRAGEVHVGGVSFSQAAVYCNWLQNGKRNDDASLMSGAYDVLSLQAGNPELISTQRLPGAQYWIPTLDEWMKAVYWDPNKPTDDGWWWFPHMSDDVPLPGPPGVGQTSTGYLDTRDDWYEFRIGDYPDSVTPWGLIDASGGVQEWTESTFTHPSNLIRVGGVLGDLGYGDGHLDRANTFQVGGANTDFLQTGFRIASSAVPAPSTVFTIAIPGVLLTRRRRH